MHTFLAQRLVIAWIALLGVLFGALAPAVSHAMAAAAPASEAMEVCTMAGMTTVVVEKARADQPAPMPDHMFKHCPYCAAHGGGHALVPSPEFVFPIVLQSGAHPPLFYRSATPLFAWSAANPRAPPVVA